MDTSLLLLDDLIRMGYRGKGHVGRVGVSNITRLEDRCAQFHPMNGETIAQTVMGKIEGAHRPDNIGTRQGATSRYAAY